MKNILAIIVVMGVAVAGACGVMATLGGITSAQVCDLGVKGSDGFQHCVSSLVNDCHGAFVYLFTGLNGVALYAQADDDENGKGEEEKKGSTSLCFLNNK